MARLGFILTSAFCLTTAAAGAQEALPAGTPTTGYAGVCPGSGNPPAVSVPAGQAPATITWPGFQILPDQGTRIFLQATVPFTYSTETRGKTFIVSMGDVRIAGENNGRPLETRFFNTPVLRVSIKRVKKETQLVLELRSDIAPRVRTETGANGYFFLEIDFPPGQYIEAPAPVVTAAPAAPAPVAPAAPAGDPMNGGSIGARASGSARVSASTDDERPPSVRASGSASGSLNLRVGGGN